MSLAAKYLNSLSEEDRKHYRAAVAELKKMEDQRILQAVIKELAKDYERIKFKQNIRNEFGTFGSGAM